MQPGPSGLLAAAVFLSSVRSGLSFSRGASYASCGDMVPGHISAHPLDPQQNHITLRTSSSSYLPGQLLVVTVRSSRDFMGFLLQARSAQPAADVWTGNRVREEMGLGPILMGGQWTLAPPGTHKLRCVWDDDTLTHSDKQLKRNLSFVWKAPDAPMGDFKFYITVVQSYFVHWAGVESPVVRDGSRASGTGGLVAAAADWNVASLLQQRLGDKTAGQSVTPETTATTSRATQSYEYLETPRAFIHPILESQEASSDSVTGPPVLPAPNSNASLPLLPVKGHTMQQEEEKTTSQHLNASGVPGLKETRDHERTSEVLLPETAHRSSPAGSTPVPQTGPRSLPSESWISLKSGISPIEEEIDKNSTRTVPNPHSAVSGHGQRAAPTSAAHFQTATHLPISTPQPSSQDLGHPTGAASASSTLVEDQPSLPGLLGGPSHHQPPGYLTKRAENRLSRTAEPRRSGRQQAQPSGPPQTFLPPGAYPASPLRKGEKPALSLHPPGFTASLPPPPAASKQTSPPHESISSPTSARSPTQTPPALPAPPSPSPVATPPLLALLQPFSSSSIPSSSLKPPSGSPLRRPSPSQHITSSPPSPHSASTITSTSTPSFFSAASVPPTFSSMSSGSPSSHPPFTPTSVSASHQQLPKDQGPPIQDPWESQPNLGTPTPPMMVHPNPEPHPNFDSHLKANIKKIKPRPPDTDDEAQPPLKTTRTPGKEGKIPDTTPRHSAWELGMLLGCSVGLGMVLVVGLRYMYRQACRKRTEVTLNDREREYARGERGLIHVQECGDLVRVRRIRDNSFVFLAEYDILSPPGD